MATFLASDDGALPSGTAQVIDGGLALGKAWPRQATSVTGPRVRADRLTI